MNRPTDKQIEEVLAGVATPEDAKFVAEWFATEEGNMSGKLQILCAVRA